MLKIKGWVVDADDKCYIVGRLKTRKNKDGGEEEYIAAPRYYGTLAHALNAILESERRAVLAEGEHTVASLRRALEKTDTELMALFGREGQK